MLLISSQLYIILYPYSLCFAYVLKEKLVLLIYFGLLFSSLGLRLQWWLWIGKYAKWCKNVQTELAIHFGLNFFVWTWIGPNNMWLERRKSELQEGLLKCRNSLSWAQSVSPSKYTPGWLQFPLGGALDPLQRGDKSDWRSLGSSFEPCAWSAKGELHTL